MDRVMRIALAQVNPIVGDLAGNARLIVDRIVEARDKQADLVCFPELVLTGYPPEDLVLKPAFVRDNLKQLEQVVEATAGISVVVGFVDDDGEIFNAAAFIRDREVKAVYHKVFLPNYGVFDEERYFAVGHRCPILEQNGIRIALTVCEDCWYPSGPMAWQAEHGVELMVNINGSPFHAAKRVDRERMVAGRAADYGAFIAYRSRRFATRPRARPASSSRSPRSRSSRSRRPDGRRWSHSWPNRSRAPRRSMPRWCSGRATTSTSSGSRR